MVGVLAQHGYIKGGDGEMRPKPYRPKTIGDARRMIFGVFERNRWDRATQARYFRMKGMDATRIEDLMTGDIRRVIEFLEAAKMLLFVD